MAAGKGNPMMLFALLVSFLIFSHVENGPRGVYPYIPLYDGFFFFLPYTKRGGHPYMASYSLTPGGAFSMPEKIIISRENIENKKPIPKGWALCYVTIY